MAIKELRKPAKKIARLINTKEIDVEKKAQEFIGRGGTIANDNSQLKVPVGRPKGLEKTVKSTVTFLNSQIVWLDRLSADIRYNSMAIIDRGSLIRAIIAALEKSDIDLSKATTEEDVTNVILDNVKCNRTSPTIK